LPAGQYRLYAIGDGRPITVILHLPGLSSGVVEVRPSFYIAPTVGHPTLLRQGAGDQTWVYGQDLGTTSAGLLIAELTTEANGANYSRSEICIYDGGSADQRGAFEPGCPGADGGLFGGAGGPSVSAGNSTVRFESWAVARGTHGIGGNATTAEVSTPTPPDFRVALVSFDPGTPVGADQSPRVVPPPLPPPLPRLARRFGRRVPNGIRVLLGCRARRDCAASARLNRWPSRRVRVPAGARRSVVLHGRARSRATVRFEALTGPEVRAERVVIRRRKR
jgi:hypothetical protein